MVARRWRQRGSYFSHESKRFVRPRNYNFRGIPFHVPLSKLGHVWTHTVWIVIVDDDYDNPGSSVLEIVSRSREEHVDLLLRLILVVFAPFR
jgi:hypothetical protein